MTKETAVLVGVDFTNEIQDVAASFVKNAERRDNLFPTLPAKPNEAIGQGRPAGIAKTAHQTGDGYKGHVVVFTPWGLTLENS
jgi:hypothetical protein